MPEVTQLTGTIYRVSLMLTPRISLHVHLVRGERYAVWIDSGVKAMFPQLMVALQSANVAPEKVRFILHTHSHHDHTHRLQCADAGRHRLPYRCAGDLRRLAR
jgi:glyoxylase-like metal-dependent hydrolase (beta-lactamase superfamily II)